jgi:uncharacterized repeat protein (TIGR02543 family)
MNQLLLVLLLLIGIAFIVFGILILFLPEVYENKQKLPIEKESKKRLGFFLWLKTQPKHYVYTLTGILLLALIVSLIPSSPANSGGSSVSSSPSSISSNTVVSSSTGGATSSAQPSSSSSSSAQPSSSSSLVEFTVTFDAMEGTPVANQTLLEQSLVSLPTSTREHFTLDGWYTSNDEGVTLDQPWNFATDKLSGDMTLYANWVAILYTISFESNGGSEVTSIQHTFGAALPALAVSSKAGETFAGWFTTETLTDLFIETTMPGNDVRLYAKWVVNPSTIVFQSNGGTAYPNLIEEIGTSLPSLPTITKVGSLFIGWFTNVELTIPVTYPFIANNANIELFAKWMIRFDGLTSGGLTHYLISETGELYGFGHAVLGSLLNITSGRPLSPVKLETPFLTEDETIITAMNAGDGTSYPFSVFLTSNGRLFSVGSNNRAQLGVGDLVDRGQPTEINLSFLNENEKVISLSLGIQHSLILTNQNRVFAWGYGGFRALGQGSNTADLVVPTLINFPGLLDNEVVSKIYGYNNNSIVITSLNRVYMWGYLSEGYGDLSPNHTYGTPRVIPIANLQENEYIVSFQHVAFGVYQFVGTTNLDRYMVWGRNENGELYDGLQPTTRRSADALNLDFIQPNETVISVVAGSSAMFVVTDTGTIYAWGRGFFGQLGHGDDLQQLTPKAIDLSHLTFLEGEKIVNVSPSNAWNFAFTSEGRLLAWGRFYSSRPEFI